ncbi:DUF2934 domain-containing protein [Caballeronia arvi]|uniref:DUF2934 domain-containing protein n=1 Tax=Caballeronia arvi TaxID=1777135 RepID=UPI00117EB2BF|nr:DUF2934 domain-containing protein [Caballeronia arvi]
MDDTERLRVAAYYLWEWEGRPTGRAEAHWERARRKADERLTSAAPVISLHSGISRTCWSRRTSQSSKRDSARHSRRRQRRAQISRVGGSVRSPSCRRPLKLSRQRAATTHP